MLVGPDHRYVFIQNPFTASTAVGKELVELYGGEHIIHKHASYFHFLKWAGGDAKNFFVFSTIRHPMDMVVSIYHKLLNNHKGNYTNPAIRRERGGWVTDRMIRRYTFIRQYNASFSDYFNQFHTRTYCNGLMPYYKSLDFVMRFESLQSDFSSVLKRLGIDQKRPLPVVNVTKRDCSSYAPFYTEDIRPRAIRIFAPQVQAWGYDFPPEWSVPSITPAQRSIFAASCLAARAYGRFSNLNRRATLTKTFDDVITPYQQAVLE